MIRFMRKKEAKFQTGNDADSTFYGRVGDGTLPPPIKIGPRASGWIAYEIEAVIVARVTGKSEDEIRELVKSLISKRTEITSGMEVT